jgi:hypothetical protein
MEEKSFQILIKMVEVQNFVRTKRVVDICKYINVCNNFVEYLVLIALLETECIGLIQVLETISKHYRTELDKREINVSVIQKIFELVCKSEKRRDLSKLLIKYYFEDQKYISKDFTKIKAKSKNLKDLVIINTIKNISEHFSYNECLVTALFGYLHIYLERGEEQIILNNPISYTSARTLVTMEPETYDNTDERFLAETCVFWMNLFDKKLKEKMIKEYKSIIQRLYCFVQ